MILKSRFNWISFVALYFLVNLAALVVLFVRYLPIFIGNVHNPEGETYIQTHGGQLFSTFLILCVGAFGTAQIYRKKKIAFDILSVWLLLEVVHAICFREFITADDWFTYGITWIIGYAVVGKTRIMIKAGELN